ncbi:J domain-containing protein [bacterium]|nr:J domain-containing protein [bacterium]
MEGIIADILRLKQSGNSGAGNQSNSWGNTETDEEKACRILGVSLNATPDEIREAYKKLAMFWHPDKGGDDKMMKEINWAYDILKREKQFV